MGINNALYKSVVFGVSAAYTGVAGALSALAIAFVAPDSFNVFLSITLLTGIVIGGLATISGAVFGALFIQFVPNWAQDISKAAPWAIFGVFLIVFMYVMPRGIAGFLHLVWIRLTASAVSRGAGGVASVTFNLEREAKHEAIQAVHCPAAGSGVAGRRRRGGGPDGGRRHRHRDQDRQHEPLQRARVRLRDHRQGHRRVLQEGQRRGRRQRPQDQLHHLDDQLQPAQDGGDGAAARRAGPGGRPLPDPGHAPQQRHPQVREPAEGAAPLRGHRRHQVERPAELPVDHGLPAQLPDRGPDVRGLRAQERARREGRHPVPERRLREGLPQGLRGRPRRRGQEADRDEAELRGDRSHDRLADREPQEQRRERVLQHHDPRSSRCRRSRSPTTSAGSRSTS